ncbi:hypothetical protein HK104_011498, partial [Borealophlyctis nickersoniae]
MSTTRCCTCFDLRTGSLLVGIVTFGYMAFTSFEYREWFDGPFALGVTVYSGVAALVILFGLVAVVRNSLAGVRLFVGFYILNGLAVVGTRIAEVILLHQQRSELVDQCLKPENGPFNTPEVCTHDVQAFLMKRVLQTVIVPLIGLYFVYILVSYALDLRRNPDGYLNRSLTVDTPAYPLGSMQGPQQPSEYAHPLPLYQPPPPGYVGMFPDGQEKPPGTQPTTSSGTLYQEPAAPPSAQTVGGQQPLGRPVERL